MGYVGGEVECARGGSDECGLRRCDCCGERDIISGICAGCVWVERYNISEWNSDNKLKFATPRK